MAAAKKKDIIQYIKDEHHFLQFIDPDNKKLVLMDVHPTWSGPCEMMFPTYRALQTAIDDFEKRVDIVMCDMDKILTYKHDKFNAHATSCKPRFVLVQEGKFVDEIAGADIPQVTEKIYKYLPMVY